MRSPAAAASLVAFEAPVRHQFAFWCLMIFTFLLFIAPQAFIPALEHLHLAKVAGGLAVAALLLNPRPVGSTSGAMAPEARLMLWLVLVAALSIPFSQWPGGSFDELVGKLLKSVVVFFLVANTLDSAARMKLLLGSLALWGLIMSVSGTNDFVEGRMVPGSSRIAGFVSPLAMGPNEFALTLNVFLALTIGLFLATREPVRRTFLLVSMGLMIAGTIASYSRGGFLGLLTIAAVFLIKRAREHGFGAIAPVLLLIMIIPFLLPQGYGERLYSMIDDSYDVSGSSTSRWEGMRLAATYILQHPLFGAGLGNDILVSVDSGAGWQETHNAFLQVGVELGLAGFIIYVWLVWRVLKGARGARRELGEAPGSGELRALGLGIELACLVYIVGACFHPVPYHFYFYYIGGFSVAFQWLVKAAMKQASPSVP